MLINWVAALEPLTRAGWHWKMGGKFVMTNSCEPHDVPWLYNPVRIPGTREEGVDCGYFTIMHNQVFQQKAVHSFCMECYKVVVVPETLEDVKKIAEWQHSCGWACKVGGERRPYTQRVWGAYFYCRGVEEGKERYEQVRAWIDENIGPHIKVFLKRGCTEFEQNLGDSDKWEKIEHQDAIEEEAKKVIEYELFEHGQGDPIKHHVWDIWVDWDKKNQPPVTYHDEKPVEE